MQNLGAGVAGVASGVGGMAASLSSEGLEAKSQEMGQKMMRGADWLAKKTQAAAATAQHTAQQATDGGGGGGGSGGGGDGAEAAAAPNVGAMAGEAANRLKAGFGRFGKGRTKSTKNFDAKGFLDD